MRIWLLAPFEPLPVDGGDTRLLGMMRQAAYLRKRGHEVVFLASTFSHLKKRHRYTTDSTVTLANGIHLCYLHTPGYRRNVSISRIVDHQVLIYKFLRKAKAFPKPDIIFASYPSPELGLAAVKLGRVFGVPVLLWIRDLWPDVFLDLVPRPLHRLARVALFPYLAIAKSAIRGASGILGNTEGMVSWGLGLAGRERCEFDRELRVGYTLEQSSPAEIERARAFWAGLGIFGSPQEFVVAFAGTLGRQFDIRTVISAAKLLATVPQIRFVLCGTGDLADSYRKLASDCPNIVMPGHLGVTELNALFGLSALALAPYINSVNFQNNIPNKIGEYLCASLPILYAVTGSLDELLRRNACGLQYRNGDAESLAARILEGYRNQSDVRAMAQRARHLYASEFDEEKINADLANYLESLHSRQDCPPAPSD